MWKGSERATSPEKKQHNTSKLLCFPAAFVQEQALMVLLRGKDGRETARSDQSPVKPLTHPEIPKVQNVQHLAAVEV